MGFPKYVQYSKTATSDVAFQVTSEHLLLSPCDVWILANDAYVGDGVNQQAPAYVGDVYTPQVSSSMPVDVSELWFKNKSAGSNTQIVVSGVAVGARAS